LNNQERIEIKNNNGLIIRESFELELDQDLTRELAAYRGDKI